MLLPLEVMLKPLELRFKYHFYGDRPTNRPDKVRTLSINALLPMVREKVFALLPKISTQPQLLSHLIHELMDFDIRLRDDWGYDGGCGADGWKGLTWEVLVQRHWFGSWLKVENDCMFNLSFINFIAN